MSDPLLTYREVTHPGRTPDAWMYVMHGIYGMGRNWATIARRLVGARPEWGCRLVDLRMHGGSQDLAPPHTVAAAAADVARLVREQGGGAHAVLGHSFGGKVALQLLAAGEVVPAEVWVIDSTPSAREPEGSAWDVLQDLRALPGPFGAREEAVAALVGRGHPRPMAQWLAMNLEAGEEGYRWRIDPEAMEELLRDFFGRDLWEVVENPPGQSRVHLVKAEGSATMSPEDVVRAREAAARRRERVHLHHLPGGHWLNADNPDGVVELLAERLGRPG